MGERVDFFSTFAKIFDMKTDEPTVTVIQDPTKTRKDGAAPLYILITWRGRAKESAGMSMTPRDFSKGLWKSDRRLKRRLQEIEDNIDRLLEDGRPFTARDVLDGKASSRAVTYMSVLTDMAHIKRLRDETIRHHITAMRSFEQYFGEGFDLKCLTLPQIQGYARSTAVSPSSMGSYLKCLNAIYNYAVPKKIVPENPMKGWCFIGDGYRERDKPKCRSRVEVTKYIRTFESPSTPPKQRTAIGVWLAGYFFNGLALCDLVRVDWKSLEKQFVGGSWYWTLTIRRLKTNEEASVATPVTRLTESLVAMMRTEPWKHHPTFQSFKQFINKHLKKTDSTLYYYQCRHTFASILIMGRTPVSVLASMMGRSVSGISTYVSKISEAGVLASAADVLRGTEVLEEPPEDLFITD